MSHHLKELEAAELISISRRGKFLELNLNRRVRREYTGHLDRI